MAPKLCFIWPKDPQPGNPSSWPRRWRLTDVLLGKGPDIYIGPIKTGTGKRAKGPPKTNWDLWDQGRREEEQEQEEDIHAPSTLNSQISDFPTDSSSPMLPAPYGPSRYHKQYDYRQRKYVTPDEGTWSMVRYCDYQKPGLFFRRRRKGQHCVPVEFFDKNGAPYPAWQWHDVVHGPGCQSLDRPASLPSSSRSGRSGYTSRSRSRVSGPRSGRRSLADRWPLWIFREALGVGQGRGRGGQGSGRRRGGHGRRPRDIRSSSPYNYPNSEYVKMKMYDGSRTAGAADTSTEAVGCSLSYQSWT